MTSPNVNSGAGIIGPGPGTPPEPASVSSPTEGLTTRVVKGSFWMILGQVAPLAVSLVATYYVIGLLGESGYGVLTLIVLIPNYFSYADLGMSMASTKFGSEAYAAGDLEREGEVVRTSLVVALCSAIPIAFGLVAFARPLLTGPFQVSPEYLEDAIVALQISAVTFLVNFVCSIVNTPQLTRMRMDLNMLVTAGPRIAGLIATPIVLSLSYGLSGVAIALLIANLLALAGNLAVSQRLMGTGFFGLTINAAMLRPLLKFGLGYVAALVAAVLLLHGEKAILTNLTSTTMLGFYSIAFTLATMLTMFSGSIVQSLLPAFSQLQTKDTETNLKSLFSAGVRLNLIWLPPAIAFLSVAGKPFLTYWARGRFGEESSMPFYILLAGIAFNIMAYLPYSSTMAAGRTETIAKLYWAEVVPYLLLAFVLISEFGLVGAAAAWSIRAVADSLIQFSIARRIANVGFGPLRVIMTSAVPILIFLPVFACVLLMPGAVGLQILILTLSTLGHVAYSWHLLLEPGERDRIVQRIASRLGRTAQGA